MICRALVSRSREEVMESAEPGATGRGTLNVMVLLSVTGSREQRPVQVNGHGPAPFVLF